MFYLHTNQVKWILPVNMNDRSEVGGNGSEVVIHIIRNVTESDSNTIYTCEQPGIREHFQLIVIGKCQLTLLSMFLERIEYQFQMLFRTQFHPFIWQALEPILSEREATLNSYVL